jgi:MFS transporter, Spinster family, sphingosine-1-phosphate transporter
MDKLFPGFPSLPFPSHLLNTPEFYFLILTILNMFNFIDRGIIPGATDEFINFIDENIETGHPDLYIGLLQSAFIVGFCLASPVFAGLVHHYGPFHLVCGGITVWTCAVLMSGFAYLTNSYEMLLFGRVLSGVGESSFQCCIPPWIATNSNEKTRSIWLATFNTAIPVGTAIGYIYSSLISTTIGWQWTFFLEAILILPFLLFLFSILPRFPYVKAGVRHFLPVNKKDEEEIVPIIPTNLQRTSSSTEQDIKIRLSTSSGGTSARDGDDDEEETSIVFPLLQREKEEFDLRGEEGEDDPPNIIEEIKAICQYPCYLYICAGYAAQTGALIGLSTFGSAFLMGLGYFDSEVTPLLLLLLLLTEPLPCRSNLQVILVPWYPSLVS